MTSPTNLAISRAAALGAAAVMLMLGTAEARTYDKSIRCGTNLIHSGGGRGSSTMYEVLKKCGEPVAKQGNTWIYVQGTMQRTLTFSNGRVYRIESARA